MNLISSDKTALLWDKLTHLPVFDFPQSVLFLGPNASHSFELTQQLIHHLLCSSENKPCGRCRSCNFLIQNTHPDVLYITQEKPTSAIKIDQIRNFQHKIYQTPLCATHRIIIIHPANELNRAAANALLKILEEPPKHAIFILLAEHLNTLPATIMSRCQRYHVPEAHLISSGTNTAAIGYLALGEHYSEESPRGLLMQQQQDIINNICDLSEGKISVCQLASTCGNHGLHDWLWFFQLFTASILKHQLLPEKPVFYDARVLALTKAHSPVHFFKQLDIIQELTKKINLDIPLNPTLALETLLMGYI
ncbi:MAG: hypothetical protein P1U36_01360 [Legionellaceae bacterium]|nr:hypothetical protein [Legionellaceae bacterium]